MHVCRRDKRTPKESYTIREETGLIYNIPSSWSIDTAFVKNIFHVQHHPREFFKMFELLPFEEIKVVIIGQSPYPDKKNACGIAFQVPDEVLICPKSLKVLFKELESDIGVSRRRVRDCIRYWISQGVFLTNYALTIGDSSIQYLQNHKAFWSDFTIEFAKKISLLNCPVVLLGSDAQELKQYIQHNKVLQFSHPASRDNSFSGCKMFSSINNLLDTPINWI